MAEHERGLWGLTCFNGLSQHQQQVLVERGGLRFGYTPMGWCKRPAEVEVTTAWDAKPGPRFYCLPCAQAFLATLPPTPPPPHEPTLTELGGGIS